MGEYFGSAQSANGDMLYYDSTDTSCTIAGLECGGFYNFSVEASGHTCNSSFAEPVLSGAGPCPPTTITTRLQYIDHRQWVRIYWDAIDCDVEYQVELTGRIQNDTEQ